MPTADLAATPTAREKQAFAQFPTAWRFALRNQTRNRLAGLLLVVFVPVWYLLMAALAGHQALSFKLFATGQVLTVDARSLTLITAGLNALTLITGFAVFAAIRRTLAFDRRLVFAGYRQATLIAAKISAIAVVAAGVAGYTAAVLLAFWRPGLAGWLAILAAFAVIALTYGALGLLLGVLVKGDLEGFFLIIMGSLMDTFLQNPLGNPIANKPILEWFPSFGPHAVRSRRGVRAHRPVGPPAPRPGLDRRLHRRRPGHLPRQDPQPPAPGIGRRGRPSFGSSLPSVAGQPEQAQEAVVHGVAGLVDRHPSGLDFVLGGPAESQGRGQQPGGRKGAVEVASFLAASDDLEQPVQDRAVPGGVLVRADGRQVPQERVPRRHLPPGVEQPDQRHGRRYPVEPGSVEGGRHLGCSPLDDRVQQRLAGREVGVDGLAADPGGPCDVIHARVRPRPQRLGRGAQDRGDAVPGVGSLPPAPGLWLR
jgi:hypothetical protein